MIQQDIDKQDRLFTIIYLIGVLLALIGPFIFYYILNWPSTHSGEPPAPGIIYVPRVDVIGFGKILSAKCEQIWSLCFGLFLLCMTSCYAFKHKHLIRYRLGLSLIMLLLAFSDAFTYLLNWNWFFGRAY